MRAERQILENHFLYLFFAERGILYLDFRHGATCQKARRQTRSHGYLQRAAANAGASCFAIEPKPFGGKQKQYERQRRQSRRAHAQKQRDGIIRHNENRRTGKQNYCVYRSFDRHYDFKSPVRVCFSTRRAISPLR
jgi:hypothetical protein